MSEWNHKGTKITMSNGGEFVFVIAGARTVKPSLAAAKKAIDEAAKSSFTPFKAIRRLYDKIVEVEIVGERVRHLRYRDDEYLFLDKGGTAYSPKSLYLDTPENRKAFDAAMAFDKKTEELERQRNEASEKLWAALKCVPAPEAKSC